jgi:hypothetical protein
MAQQILQYPPSTLGPTKKRKGKLTQVEIPDPNDPLHRTFITPNQFGRRVVTPADEDPLGAEAALRAVARDGRSQYHRRTALAQVCGWMEGTWGADKVAGVYAWPPARAELRRFVRECAAPGGWRGRVPPYRVVQGVVACGLVRGCDRWTAHDEAPRAWDGEDYYARFVLRVLAAVRERGADARGVMRWVVDMGDEERIWTFYHFLLLIHYEYKWDAWKKLPVYKRIGKQLSGGLAKDM